MANVRDSDTSLWLHNKLGTSNDLWSGGSICSQLSQDVLRNIKDCFIDLQAQVKLKLLLSFLHISKRNIDEWKVELEEILELAIVDSDQWVSMLAELLKSYPSSGTVNMGIEENARVFSDLLTELKKLVKKNSDFGMIPMECLYLNKNALATVVGQQIQAVKHFTLKRKPKSAALRAELLQKSNDAANNLKKNVTAPGILGRSRSLAKRMDDTTPLKGFPSRITGVRRITGPSAISNRPLPKTPAGRKDGGIKILEITEQPIGFGREAKRRKKLPDEVMDAQKLRDKEPNAGSSPTISTPEYAVGLASSSILPQIPDPSTPVSLSPSVSTSFGTTSTSSSLSSPATSTPGSQPLPTATPLLPTVGIQARENLQTQPTRIQIASQQSSVVSSTTPTIILQQLPSSNSDQAQPPTPTPASSTTVPAVIVAAVAQAQGPLQSTQSKKGLSLTREQMQEAQEMFRTANKVTRPEKALILGFMAGARDNPCPHLGNIVTIKLSENQENVTQPDGTVAKMMVEMHFQMNYNTGEWKRVRKFRKIEE